MNDKLIFGAAYYEEYLPEDRLERDMELMAAAGLNTVRIGESTWSVEEPQPGTYDFSHVTRVIESAARRGLDVILGTPTYAIPPWLAAKRPAMLGDNRFGPRQNFDLTDPVYRRHAEKIIREMVMRTAPYPNVIGYQLDNETKVYPVHTERLAAGFRKWLQARFGTVDKLCRAMGLYHWSNSAASFDELPDPVGTVNGSYACAFEQYKRELAADFLNWQARIVSECKRDDQFLTHNFDFAWHTTVGPRQQMGFSRGLQPDMDQFISAQPLDVVGADVYCPCAGALTGLEIAFAGDVMRPLKHGKNYLVMESQAQCFTGHLPYPGQLRLMALSHLAAGARGLFYWPWLSLHNGIESYWKGVLSHDGEPGEVYEQVRSIGSELRRLTPELSGLRKDNQIALIVSPEALHALDWFPTEEGLSYNDVLLEFYRALYELNLECDVLSDKQRDWSAYKLLIFPQLYCCTDEMTARVRAFVTGGGTVLASFRSFFADENLQIRHDRQPHGLTDVFGMHYSQFTRSEEGRWMELLETGAAIAAGRYEHKYWGGVPAATRNRLGRGHAWYLGTRLDVQELKDFLLRVCDTAGLDAPNLRAPVAVRRAVGADGKRVTFLFNYSDEPRTVQCPAAGRELLTGKTFTRGTEFVLPDWGAAILREQ